VFLDRSQQISPVMVDHLHVSLSQLSLSSSSSQNEDWDRSIHDDSNPRPSTPRNSVTFPGDAGGRHEEGTPRKDVGNGRRTLSDLLKMHAEKGTDVTFSPEEASRLADVLGQWINSGCSPYESEDDFFSRSHSQDDMALSSSKRSPSGVSFDITGRPRGQSESMVKSVS